MRKSTPLDYSPKFVSPRKFGDPNSIIAQNSKGLVNQITSEQDISQTNAELSERKIETSGNAGFDILKLTRAEATIGAEGNWQKNNQNQSASKEVLVKTLHDASFDMAYSIIQPAIINLNNNVSDHEMITGTYIELTRKFTFMDMSYINNLISNKSFIELLKNNEKAQINNHIDEETEKLNRDARRKNNSQIEKERNILLKQIDKQYDETVRNINLFKEIIPYNRMLISDDRYLLPLEDQYFRINPTTMGFMYGGELHSVGMITNLIGNDLKMSSNPFAVIQRTINETLKNAILTDKDQEIIIVQPLAVYYESN